jgi:Ion channel
MSASVALLGTDEDAKHRYGVVLLILLAIVAFSIVAPEAPWSRAVGFALEVLALVFTVATSRARSATRRGAGLAAGAAGIVLIVAIATRGVPAAVAFALSGIISAAIPVSLVSGVMRLLRNRGVTREAVAGALSIYLLVGLLFAFAIGFIARVQQTPYFAQQHTATVSSVVYYSFTVMTTTGFGDLTAITHLGRALAVLEMLIGQVYLVVIIGLLVSNVGGGRRASKAAD